MLAEVLAAGGHAASLVPDHDTALARFEPGRYDAALIDLGLPGPGGDALAAALRRADPALAIGVLTGWGRERDLADLDPACVDFTATKPLDMQRLGDLLADAARRTAARRSGQLPEA
jgi:DNA-binding response OmpR family regulator